MFYFISSQTRSTRHEQTVYYSFVTGLFCVYVLTNADVCQACDFRLGELFAIVVSGEDNPSP